MGRHQNADLFALRKLGQRFQKAHFVFEVQRRGRLVQKHQRCLLRQCAGKQHQLELAAGKGCIGAVGKAFQPNLPQRFVADRGVLFAGNTEQPRVRRASHAHHLAHRIGEGGRVLLRHIGNLFCKL